MKSWGPCTFGLVLVAAILFGLSVNSGCGGDYTPDDPEDPSANAGLRLWVELDYVTDFGYGVDYLSDWHTEILQGSQSGDCSFLYNRNALFPEIDVQLVQGSELFWKDGLADQAELGDFLDTNDQILEMHSLLSSNKSSSQQYEPNLHLVIGNQLIDPHTPSEDTDRWPLPWKFTDDDLPTGATYLGWVIFHPYHGFRGCNQTSYDTFGPSGVVFLGTIDKAVTEINEVLNIASPNGCGGVILPIDSSKVAIRALSHELFHELGMPDFDPGGDICHDASCDCVMNGSFLRVIWVYVDKQTWPDFFNCATASTWISRMHSLCVGEAENASHYKDVCSYNDLRVLNPSDYD